MQVEVFGGFVGVVQLVGDCCLCCFGARGALG